MPDLRPRVPACVRRLGAAVLVGGRSTRLGSDKALVEIDGVAAARRVLDAVRPLVEGVCLVGGEGSRFESWDVPWVPDAVADAGPLAGIVTGLRVLGADACFALACDAPLLSTAVLACLRDAYDAAPQAQAVVPRLARGLEPLVAIYTRAALPALEDALARGERALYRVLARMQMHEVDEATLRRVDAALAAFVNVNTPTDLARVRALRTTPLPE